MLVENNFLKRLIGSLAKAIGGLFFDFPSIGSAKVRIQIHKAETR